MKPNWFELKYVGPVIIAVACLWDAGLRFFPERLETFRAWESALVRATGDGEFRQNFVYDNPRSFGDLSNLSNCESCRVYRREKFTTDAYGFRNAPSNSPYNTVLVGDSFGVGSGLSDEDTLSRQLDRILPETHVYNASAQKPQWGHAAKVIERERIRGSFLIWEHAQLHPFPTGTIDIPLSRQRLLLRQWNGGQEPGWYQGFRALFRWTQSWLGYSPLKMAVQKELRQAEMHGLLPSGSAEVQVAPVALTNGQTILNYLPEIETIRNPSRPDLDFFRRLRAAVRGHRQRTDRGAHPHEAHCLRSSDAKFPGRFHRNAASRGSYCAELRRGPDTGSHARLAPGSVNGSAERATDLPCRRYALECGRSPGWRRADC